MTDKPYTNADVELVASTFVAEAKKNPIDSATPLQLWMGAQGRLLLGPTEHDIARAVLDALAAAGRLLPTGTDTVEQWGTRITRDGVLFQDPDAPTTRVLALARVDWHARKRAEEPGWRGAAVLVHCFQHTTPWTPVDSSSVNPTAEEKP